jgi:hypothetical protein
VRESFLRSPDDFGAPKLFFNSLLAQRIERGIARR